MQKQPYIYTMPEGFLQDESIGVKWKLYAIINGFWISGKTCFGGNDFFATKLGVSERQIRNGLAQLEEEGYIERVILGNKRVIQPKGQVVEEEGDFERGGSQSSAGGGSQSSAEAEAGLPHISVSISESITGVANATGENSQDLESQDIDVVAVGADGEELTPRWGGRAPKKVTPQIQSVFDIFTDQPARLVWRGRVHQREAAKVLYETYGLEELQRRYKVVRKYRNEPMCPQINNPSDFLEKMTKMEQFLKSL